MSSFSKKYVIIVALCLVSALCASAMTLEEAKAAYLAGDYASALPTFQEQLKRRPKDARLNHWTGVCLYQTGNIDAAIPLLEFAHSKGVVESPRFLAEITFNNYQIEEAQEYADDYRTALDKANATMSDEAEITIDRIDRAYNMLDRVEKIVIIDSLTIDKNSFLSAYRLSPESGTLSTDATCSTAIYTTENSQLKLWADVDSSGCSTIVEATALIGGTWDTPHHIEELSESGNACYPFLMPDGTTLYFASDGDQSIGGYDIFVTNRGEDGFLEPQNIGMPYNSPFNDYMLAIDELTGIGWWATDRNSPDGMVTIYKFIPNDMRVNYPSDEPNLIDYARIASYKATWTDGADYSNLLRQIDNIGQRKSSTATMFRLSMPSGKIYTTLDDFINEEARERMSDYLDAQNRFDNDTVTLQELRRQYASGDTSVSNEILSLERQQLDARRELQRILNDVIRLEQM